MLGSILHAVNGKRLWVVDKGSRFHMNFPLPRYCPELPIQVLKLVNYRVV